MRPPSERPDAHSIGLVPQLPELPKAGLFIFRLFLLFLFLTSSPFLLFPLLLVYHNRKNILQTIMDAFSYQNT